MAINENITEKQIDEFLNSEEITGVLDNAVNNWIVEVEDTGIEEALSPEGINKIFSKYTLEEVEEMTEVLKKHNEVAKKEWLEKMNKRKVEREGEDI